MTQYKMPLEIIKFVYKFGKGKFLSAPLEGRKQTNKI